MHQLFYHDPLHAPVVGSKHVRLLLGAQGEWHFSTPLPELYALPHLTSYALGRATVLSLLVATGAVISHFSAAWVWTGQGRPWPLHLTRLPRQGEVRAYTESRVHTHRRLLPHPKPQPAPPAASEQKNAPREAQFYVQLGGIRVTCPHTTLAACLREPLATRRTALFPEQALRDFAHHWERSCPLRTEIRPA